MSVRSALACAALAAFFGWPAPVAAQRASVDGDEDPVALRLPVRLTAGESNEFMGERGAPDGPLYFVSDAEGTRAVYAQPTGRAAAPALPPLGDRLAPRLSPDGSLLAYVSFVRDSQGDACVLALASREERCLTDAQSAELDVFWWGDDLGVITRPEPHADLAVLRFPGAQAVGGRRVAGLANVAGVAAAPDGEHLAYVRIDRRRENVGVSFSSRVGDGLFIADGSGQGAVHFVPELPGRTGYPAFGPEGRFLYFAQYLNDTNRDGVIDGGDNSVLFRVRFDPTTPTRTRGRPEQLTSARWNCHYPSTDARSLLMTCSHEGSLDVYGLPLDGAVPAEWDAARLAGEIEVVRDLWSELLLWSRWLALDPEPAARRAALRRVVWVHLALRERRSAAFYAERLRELARLGVDSNGEDEGEADVVWADVRWAEGMLALIGHRDAAAALDRGGSSRPYVAAAQERLRALRALGDDPLVQIAAVEIEADLGRLGEALGHLRAIDLRPEGPIHDRATLELVAAQARRLFAHVHDEVALRATLRAVATHPALPPLERCRLAAILAEDILRGQPESARQALLVAYRREALGSDPGNAADEAADEANGATAELALMLDAYIALADLSDEEATREQIFALYRSHELPAHRRALALTTVRWATERGLNYLPYQFATTYASGVRQADPERGYAEEVYRAVVLERGYGEAVRGETSEASGYFFQATRNTGALDAHIGFVEAQLRLGQDVAAFYARRFANDVDAPEVLFVQAYLEARAIPEAPFSERAAMVERVVARLARVDELWPRRIEVHQLWGYALHQRAVALADRDDAAAALRQYRLALDLARDRPRARAAILHALAVLQQSLGNHRQALESLHARARLPFTEPIEELACELGLTRALVHAEHPEPAAEHGRRALALAQQPALRSYEGMALDRLAYAQRAAGREAEAVETYGQLLGLEGAEEAVRPINRFKAYLGRGSARLALGQWSEAASDLEQARALLVAHPDLEARARAHPLEGAAGYGHGRYEALVAGLLGEARLRLGDHEAALALFAARRATLEALLAEAELDADLDQLARAELQLARGHLRAGRRAEARAHLSAGLSFSDRFNASTGSELTATRVALLSAAAALDRDALPSPLVAQLRAAYDFIIEYPSPQWAQAGRELELYLSLAALQDARGDDRR